MNQMLKLLITNLIISGVLSGGSTIFPYIVEDKNRTRCLAVSEPSVARCRSIDSSDRQERCCYSTYVDGGTTKKTCGYLENTEFGIKVYKHLFAGYKKVKIACRSDYIKMSLLSLLFLSLIIL